MRDLQFLPHCKHVKAANNQGSEHRVQRAGLLSRLMDESRDVVFGGRLKGMKSMRSIYFLIRW